MTGELAECQAISAEYGKTHPGLDTLARRARFFVMTIALVALAPIARAEGTPAVTTTDAGTAAETPGEVRPGTNPSATPSATPAHVPSVATTPPPMHPATQASSPPASPEPLPLPRWPEFTQPLAPAPTTRVGDLSGWITAGVLWGAVVHPVYRSTRDSSPSAAKDTTSTPGFFVGSLPGRGNFAGGALFTYRPGATFAGGKVGLWYIDLQGHVLPKGTLPLSLYLALHMGSLSWTAPNSGYSSSEFTAGLGVGAQFAPIRHVAVIAEYRLTGLFDESESYSCGNGQCSHTGSDDHSKYMHLFTLGVALSYF